MFLTFASIAGASYLVGSFPTAYLLVKWKTQQDVRKVGTGNVGALNSFEVTRSKVVGIGVLVVDLAKGAAAIMLCCSLFGNSLVFLGLSAAGVIIGHNYPIWLRFQGGRGLAPAAGALLVINWIFVIVWCAVWLITYGVARNVHKGNIVAIVVTPIISALLAGSMVEWGVLQKDDSGLFILLGFLLSTLLFLRHFKPLKEMLSKKAH